MPPGGATVDGLRVVNMSVLLLWNMGSGKRGPIHWCQPVVTGVSRITLRFSKIVPLFHNQENDT
jgi:hypothetical protein